MTSPINFRELCLKKTTILCPNIKFVIRSEQKNVIFLYKNIVKMSSKIIA